MPPQQGQQTPGEDVLLDTLRRSKITDEQRQSIWDAYHTQGDEKSWVGGINKLEYPDDVKQTLYDMRWKGFKNLPTKGPEAVQQPAATPQVQTPQAPAKTQTAQLQAQPGLLDKAASLIFGDANTQWGSEARALMHGDFKKAAQIEFTPKSQFAAPAQSRPIYQPADPKDPYYQQHPVIRAVRDVASGLTTPESVATLMGTGGLGEVGTAANALFRTQMAVGTGEAGYKAAKAIQAGDSSEAKYQAATGVLTGLMTAHGGFAPDEAPATKDFKGGAYTEPVSKAPAPQAPATPASPVFKSEAIGAVAGTPTKDPLRLADSLRAENYDLNARLKGVSGPDAAVIQQRINENHAQIAEHEKARFSQNQPVDVVAPRPVQPAPLPTFTRAESPMRPYDPTGTRFAKGGTVGMEPVDFSEAVAPSPKPEGQPPLKVTVDNVGLRWAEDPVSGRKVTVPKRIADSDVETYARPEIAKQVSGNAAMQQHFKDNPVVPVQAEKLNGAKPEPIETVVKPTEGPKVVARNFDLPSQVKDDISTLVDKRMGIQTTDAEEASPRFKAMSSAEADLTGKLKGSVREHLRSLTNEQVLQLRDKYSKSSEDFQKQADAVRELTDQTVKNRDIKKSLIEMKASGGPVKRVATGGVDPETGEAETIGVKPQADVKRGGRLLINDLLGYKNPQGAEVFHINDAPKGVSDEEWGGFVQKELARRDQLTHDIKKQFELQTSLSEISGGTNEVDQEGFLGKIRELDELEKGIGKYALSEDAMPAGRRANLPPEKGPSGEIKTSEALPTWNLKRAEAVFGKDLRKMPTDEEFYNKADELEHHAKLHSGVSVAADKTLDARKAVKSQRGSVGEGGAEVKIAADPLLEDDSKRFSVSEVTKAATKNKINHYQVSDSEPAGDYGWLSKDGKTFIDNGNSFHDDVAEMVTGDPSGYRGLLKNGWIRVADSHSFQVDSLTKQHIATIEMMTIRNGNFGRPLAIDFRDGVNYAPTGFNIPSGWDNLSKAIDRARLDRRRQLGAGGVTNLASAAVGAGVGYAAGGVPGAFAGWTLGFISPSLLQTSAFKASAKAMKPIVSSMHDFIMGPEQEPSAVPTLKNITEKQHQDIQGPTSNYLSRIAQLPGDLMKQWSDKNVLINENPGALGKKLLNYDKRGQVFRDLNGKISIDDSPYVSLMMAEGKASGLQEAHMHDYSGIVRDAQKGGIYQHLTDYLNLKGYARANAVVDEKVADLQANIQNIQSKLQSPSLTPRQKIALNDDMVDTQAQIDEYAKKKRLGKITPDGFDTNKINSGLQQMQQSLGQAKYAQVEQLAQRVFGMNRKVLDLLHQGGIVSDENYQKFTGRGDEYVPMSRILSDLSESAFQRSGNKKQYLMRQNVIHALDGSERVNRHPIVASADANLEALRELTRNDTMGTFVDLAKKDPQGVGSELKPVPQGYKPQAGEQVVAHYQNGLPQHFAVPEYLGQVLDGPPIAAKTGLNAAASFFQRMLQTGATGGNLAFSLPNALRHFGDFAALSEAGVRPKAGARDVARLLSMWGESFLSTVRKDATWQDYVRSGAGFSTLQRQISPEHFVSLDQLGWKGKLIRGRVLDLVKDVNGAIEDSTKLTAYRRAREAGMSEKSAGWETMNYGGAPNFSRGGTMAPSMNLVSMFFNAHLQYVSRVFKRAQENPARVGMALAAVAAMSLSLNEHNWNQKDDQGRPLMNMVSKADRENYFNVLTGETARNKKGDIYPVGVKIPKPSFVKFLYNPIENFINKEAGREQESAKQLTLDSLSSYFPGQMHLEANNLKGSLASGLVSSTNPIIRLPIEEAANKTPFGPVVPTREQKIEPAYQFGPSTSKTAVQMGQGGLKGAEAGAVAGGTLGYLFGGYPGAGVGAVAGAGIGTAGVSPRRLDHIQRGIGGGISEIATTITNPFFGGVKESRPLSSAEETRQTPIVGPIGSRFQVSPVNQEAIRLERDFYDKSAKVSEKAATFDRLKNDDKVTDAAVYLRLNRSQIEAGRFSADMQAKLGELNSQIRRVQEAPNMPEETRTEVLKNFSELKMRLLKQFNQILDRTEQRGDDLPRGNGNLTNR